jgi:hypothetical protein
MGEVTMAEYLLQRLKQDGIDHVFRVSGDDATAGRAPGPQVSRLGADSHYKEREGIQLILFIIFIMYLTIF